MENLVWIIPLAAVIAVVALVLCGCKIAGDYDRSTERDAATLMNGERDECYYCPFPCEHNK